MKKLILITITVLFFGTQEVFSKGIPIPVGNAEHIKETFDLPDTDAYKSESGKYLNLGVKYEVFEVVWVPVWLTEKPVIVGVEAGKDDSYFDLTPEQISGILKENKITEEDVLKVSFFSKYTGLLIIVPLVLFAVWGFFTKDKEEEETAK